MTYIITHNSEEIDRCETLAEVGAELIAYDKQASGVEYDSDMEEYVPWSRDHWTGAVTRMTAYAADTEESALVNAANNVFDFGDAMDWHEVEA